MVVRIKDMIKHNEFNENFVFRVNMHVEILEITTHIVGSRLIMIKCGLHNCYNTSNQA